MLAVIFALLAGILTITTPCTLPVLPILLGSSIGRARSLRPVVITLGFVTSFSLVVILFSAITQVLGVDQNTLRAFAAICLIGFAVVMLCPRTFERITPQFGRLIAPLIGRQLSPLTGNAGGFLLGTTLGLVWTPCAGPVLGSIITVIATGNRPAWGALLLIVYALGAAAPMLAIAYGGQVITTRVKSLARISPVLQRGFAVVIICFAIAMYFQQDALVIRWLGDVYPGGQPAL